MSSPINFEQYRHYSKPGPRYTSYPTAVEFAPFTQADYLKALQTQEGNRNLSLYFHLPFCKTPCYFCGCSTVITSSNDKKDDYIELVKKEMDLVASHIDTTRTVSQLHLGGGTPTYFSSDNLRDLIEHAHRLFPNFQDDAEISCEVDPRQFTEEKMRVLADYRFNRISFGVQDFDQKVQESVNRIQSFDLVHSVVEIAKKYSVKSINVDLIYGLPFQREESFKKTIEKTLSLDPDRLAIFNYAHVPWIKKIMNRIDEKTLPNPAEKLAILKMIIDTLGNSGYEMIGMDHFAKPEDELFLAIDKNQLYRNFQGYTTKRGSDLVGFGMTSIGYGEHYYAQNEKDLIAYEKAINAREIPIAKGIWLSDDDRLRQKVILSLMSNFYLDIPSIEKTFNIDFANYFEKELSALEHFVQEGFVEISPTHISILNQTARMIIRNIVMVFDAYLSKIQNRAKTFSKTI